MDRSFEPALSVTAVVPSAVVRTMAGSVPTSTVITSSEGTEMRVRVLRAGLATNT